MIIGFVIGISLYRQEPKVVVIPPIMELVSAPSPPQVPTNPIQEVRSKVKPTIIESVANEQESKPIITPSQDPPKTPPKIKIKKKPQSQAQEKLLNPAAKPKEIPVENPPKKPEEEWDVDFETDEPAPQVQKVVAPKLDHKLKMFENTVRSKIMKNFSPPKGLGLPYGTEFLIEITCLRKGGRAVNVRVFTSSGAYSLDKYGLRAIKLAILPEIPPNYSEDQVKLHVKFVYNE